MLMFYDQITHDNGLLTLLGSPFLEELIKSHVEMVPNNISSTSHYYQGPLQSRQFKNGYIYCKNPVVLNMNESLRQVIKMRKTS